MRVLVWNEHYHERARPEVAEQYPDGIHAAVADALDGADVRTATLEAPDAGLGAEALSWADALVWWSHAETVPDDAAQRVVERVRDGLGFVVLHAGKNGKPFRWLVGTDAGIKYREAAETERVWTVEPGHPVAEGVPGSFELPATEMYGEPWRVPAPDTLVFASWFEGGETFRSGCCYRRGSGRIFYFRPGHEEYPVYHDGTVRRVLRNAVRWVG
jgi:trehalose utilization protein